VVTHEEALAGALDQIAAAFGKEECLTPKQREMRVALNAKLRCLQCGKKLSRKTARLINGRALCSSCMFASG
jgi:formylmethanofuran dehydrogenase subunit E